MESKQLKCLMLLCMISVQLVGVTATSAGQSVGAEEKSTSAMTDDQKAKAAESTEDHEF